MEKSLKSIVNVLCDENSNIKDLNEYFSYMIDSIPYPPNNTSINFPLTNNFGPIEINSCYYKDLNISFNPSFLLSCMRKRNILLIFKMLLLEKRILIVGKDTAIISKIIINFLNLLYPFEWFSSFSSCITVLSERMLNLLDSFLPFIFGIRTDLFKETIYDTDLSDDVFIFYLDENKFEISNNLKQEGNKHINVKDFIEKNVTPLPKDLEDKFIKELRNIQKDLNLKDKNLTLNKDFEMRNLFMQIIAELIFDYEGYSNKIDNDNAFNVFSFITNKDKKYRPFCEELVRNNKLFEDFIQKYLLNPKKNYYFKKRLSDFEKIKKYEIEPFF